MSDSFHFRFWGVRGSIATPGPDTVRYGGNTPCVALNVGGRLIIFDGGTGLRELGQHLISLGTPIDADLFLSHLHWDHIQGIPFFVPAFVPGHTFRIHGERKSGLSLRDVLEGQMNDPTFPVPFSIMQSNLSIEEIKAGETVQVGPSVTVRTASMNHPNGCIGMRVEHDGRSLVYTTDTEHDPVGGGLDPNVVELAQGADVFIYDSMYTEAEYGAGKVGWGHSTYAQAIRLARAANVKRLFFFHHDPMHDDEFLDARLAEARLETAKDSFTVEMAREGVDLTV